jgi:N-acetylmuramoyl-L-alanine amidase
VELARERKADLFISIHFNSMPVESVNIVETFYFGPQADKRVLELAEKENAGSGYGVGDFRQVIERISDTLKTQESRNLAVLLQRHLYGNLRREERKFIDAGIKTAPFVVLLGSDVPSVLAEVSCLSNELEARSLEGAVYRERIAGYLRDGIVDYLDQKQKTDHNQIAKGEFKHVANQ